MDYAYFKLATDHVPVADRAAYASAMFGREVFTLELQPHSGAPFHIDVDLHVMPGLKIVSGTANGVIAHRSTEALADGNDDLFLSLNESGLVNIAQRGQDVSLRPGDATLFSCAEPVRVHRRRGQTIGLSVPRTLFAHMPGMVEHQLCELIRADNEPLRLLRVYVSSIQNKDGLSRPELRQLAVSHIHDLLLLVVEDAGHAREQAKGGGLHAVRSRLVKAFISRELTTDLSIRAVAEANQISERYVQRLFEKEGTTFTAFVNEQRLGRAFQMLQRPRHAGRSISTIAYECGFGDVTHFNRLFRQFYDLTPSDVRRGKLGTLVGSNHES